MHASGTRLFQSVQAVYFVLLVFCVARDINYSYNMCTLRKHGVKSSLYELLMVYIALSPRAMASVMTNDPYDL